MKWDNSTVKFCIQFLLAEESSEQTFPFWPPNVSLPVQLYLSPQIVFSPSLLLTAMKQATCSAFWLDECACYLLTQALSIWSRKKALQFLFAACCHHWSHIDCNKLQLFTAMFQIKFHIPKQGLPCLLNHRQKAIEPWCLILNKSS